MKSKLAAMLLLAIVGIPALGQQDQSDPQAVRSGWFVQVGSYSSQLNARQVLDQTIGMGLPALMRPVSIGKATWYVVRIGPYETEGSTQKDLERVRRGGFALAKIVKVELDAETAASTFVPGPTADEYRKDFEVASTEGTVSSYETFAKRYCGIDPEGLVSLAAQRARTMRHAADRKIMLVQLPGMIENCENVEEQMAHERKVGEASGFVNKQLMYELGQKKVYCDENLKTWKKDYKLLKSAGDASAYLDQFVPSVCPTATKPSASKKPQYDFRTDFKRLEEGVGAFFTIQKEGGFVGVWDKLQTGYAAFEKKPDAAQFQYLAALDLANYRWAAGLQDIAPVSYTSYPEEVTDIRLVRERLIGHCSRLVASRDEADQLLAAWLPMVQQEMDNHMKSKLAK